MRAAHQRLEKRTMFQLLEVQHSKNPRELAAKLLAEIDGEPAPVATPFQRLWARVKRRKK